MPQPDDARRQARRVFGQYLHAARREHGMSMAELARRAGLSLGYISDVEKERKLPSLDSLPQLAAALGMSSAQLLAKLEPWASVRAAPGPPADP